MFRQHQARLTYALAAVYAATMLLGQGLHLLVCAHDHAAELNHSTAGYAAGGAHGEAAVPGHAAERPHAAEPLHAAGYQQVAGSSDGEQHDANCPICQFHSQGQIVAPSVEPGIAPLDGGDAVSPLPPVDCCVRVAAYSSRAPPRS